MKSDLHTFFQFKENISKEWDSFVFSNPDGSIHQITKWRNFQLTIPGRERVFGFGLRDPENNIVATTWCVQMHTGFGKKYWFYSARGPVFSIKNPKIQSDFLKEVSQVLQEKGGVFWRLDPYFTKEVWNKIKKTGLKFSVATKNFQPTDSLMLNLDLSKEELFAQMKRTGRRNLKLAKKSGITIKTISAKEITKKDIDDFYKLNTETTQRDKFFGHEASYYKNFIQKLEPFAYLYFAEHEGQRVAAAITTFCDKQAIYYFGASSSNHEHRKLRAPYLLQWQMILEAKEKGCKTYDFTGITPVDQPNHPYAGITQFKTRFGGYRETFDSGKEITLNSFWHPVYKLIKKIRR